MILTAGRVIKKIKKENKNKVVKYIIRHFIFVFFIYFFYHSSYRKDHFTVLNLKFGTQDFTDPRSTKDPADPQWFVVVVLTSQVFPSQKGQFLLSAGSLIVYQVLS